MTFPVVEATNTSTANFGTSHSVALPAGIQADDLLLVFFNIANVGETVTFPGGWTKFVDHSSAGDTFVVAWRKATGGEGGSITVTTSGSDRSQHNSYRISGAADPIGQQVPQGSAVNGSNPPALTPTGGAKDYLWITAHGYNNTDLTTAPANYGNTLEARLTTGSCFSARRNLNASSENPGAWGAVGATAPVAVTVAVHPLPITCDLTGTVTDHDEEDIRAGGSTIILTLNDGTWAAGGSSFDNQRQGIIDGLDSDGSEENGWNAVVQPAIPVGNVVRTSDTVVTITLPAVATYFLDDQENITATIPASAVQEAVDPIVAVPTFTITNAPTGVFPQVEATAQSTQLDGADRTLDLPSGIVAGNLLLLLLWIGNTTSVVDNPSGWT